MFRGWGSSKETQGDPKHDLTTGLSGFGDADDFDVTRGGESPDRQKTRMSLQELMANADLSEANNPDDPFAAALDDMSFDSDGSSIISSNTPRITVKDPFASDSSEEDSEEESDEENEEEVLPAVSANSLIDNPLAVKDNEEASLHDDHDEHTSEHLENSSVNQPRVGLQSNVIHPEPEYSEGEEETSQQDDQDEYSSENSENSSPSSPNRPQEGWQSESIKREYFEDDEEEASLDNDHDEYTAGNSENSSTNQPRTGLHSEISNPEPEYCEDKKEIALQDDDDEYPSENSESSSPSATWPQERLQSEIIVNRDTSYSDDEGSLQHGDHDKYPSANPPLTGLHSEIIYQNDEQYDDDDNDDESDQETPLTGIDSVPTMQPHKSISQSRADLLPQEDHGVMAINNADAPDSSFISIQHSNTGLQSDFRHQEVDPDSENDLPKDTSVGRFDNSFSFMQKENEHTIGPGEGNWQATEEDGASEDYSDSDSEDDSREHSQSTPTQFLNKEVESFDEEEDYTDSEGSDTDDRTETGFNVHASDEVKKIGRSESEKSDSKFADREDTDRAISTGLDLKTSDVYRGEVQIVDSPRFDHGLAETADSDDNRTSIDTDDNGTSSCAGSREGHADIPDNEGFPSQQAVVSESEEDDEQEPESNQTKEMRPGESIHDSKADLVDNIKYETDVHVQQNTEIVVDFELALLENIEQARQKKERDLQEKSSGFFSSILSRPSNIDDGKSLASKSLATNSSKASGFLGLFGKQELGGKSAFGKDDDDREDEESIESQPGVFLPQPGDRGPPLKPPPATLSPLKSLSGGNHTEGNTSHHKSDLISKPEVDTTSNVKKASAISKETSDESSDEEFVPSSRLAAQMKEFGFDDLFGDEVNLQPPDSSDVDDDDDSSVNGSLSELVEGMVKPIPSTTPVPLSSHLSTSTNEKQVQADRSYHSDVSSMQDDDNLPLDGVSAAEVSEKESESSGSYETDSSEDDGSFKLGPKEAPLLRLENVTAMTRNNIPEDKIAASKKKNSGAWFGWGRKNVGKSPVTSSHGAIKPVPPSPSSSQMSSIASSASSSAKKSSPQSNLPPITTIETSGSAPGLETKEKKRSKTKQDKAEDQHSEASASYSARTSPQIEPISMSKAGDKSLNRSSSNLSSYSHGSSSFLSPRVKPSERPVNFSPLINSEFKNKTSLLSPGGAALSGDSSVINGGMSVFSGFSGISGISGDGKRRRRKKKKGLGDHLGKVRKVGRHGDEISVGTISKQAKTGTSGVQHVMLNTTRDIFGNDDLDGGKRPWEGAKEKKRKEKDIKVEKLQSHTSLEGFFPDTFGVEDTILEEHTDALDDIDNLSRSEHQHYYVAEETTKDNRLLDDFESSSSSNDDVPFGSSEERNGWVEDEAVDINVELDELHAMAKLESKLQVETVEVDFDDMWEKVDVDAETALKYEIRKREKTREKEKKRIMKEKEKEEKVVQRLRLFVKNGGDKRKGKAKLTKEFVRAIQSLFDEDEVDGSSSDDERRKPKRLVSNSDDFSVAPSVKSVYMIAGDTEAADKDHSNNSSRGDTEDNSKSDSNSVSEDLRSLRSHKSHRSRSSRSSKISRSNKPRLDPAAVFESEMRRVKQSKVMSVSSLRQEMSDRRGTSINLIQKEYMTFKKKQHNPDKHKIPLQDDSGLDSFQLEGFGVPSGLRGSKGSGSFRGSMSGVLHRSLRDDDPIEEKGLAAHLSRWNQDDGVTSLDDLATVQNSPRAQASTGIGIAAMAKDLAKLPDSVIDLAQRPVYKMSNFALPNANTPASLATSMTPRKSPKKKSSRSPSPRESPASLPSLSELNGKDNSTNFPSTFHDNQLATIAELEDDDDKLGVFGNTKSFADDDGDRSVVSDKRTKGGFFGKMSMKRTPKSKKGSMQLLGDERGLLSG